MIKDLFNKIKELLIGETPRLIDELNAIVEKEEKELEPKIEKVAEEVKTEVAAEVKKIRKKK